MTERKRAPRGSSPEVWLTPLIGLCLLAPMIYHWRNYLNEGAGALIDSHWLRAHIWLAIAAGLVPLLVAAAGQGGLRGLKWPGWVQVVAAGLVGCLTVGVFYYIVLYPLPNWPGPSGEESGDVLTLFTLNVIFLGLLGGLAAFASEIVAGRMARR